MPPPVSLDPGRVLIGLDAPDKDALLRTLCETVRTAPGVPDGLSLAALLAAVQTREAERSTLLGRGFACPHARVPGVEGVRVAVATLKRPLPWDDEGEARWVVLMVGPHERPAPALRLLAQLATLARDDEAVEHILAADDPTTLATWLDRRLREEEGPLCAVDVMRDSLDRIGPDMPVPELARRMAAHRLDAAGVTDDERRLLGVVTADDLFTLGMPDFFKQLKSVAFIAEFDPFEKYFQHEASLTARDVMRPTPATVGPDATILEVVFLLAVQGHPKVFVVDDQRRLLGVIDRIRVLDRILNL